ncbi:MAG: ribokinase, partial [Crenarchaeota archaeon]|nr:ribokinase [Thermoproteota archaeon]
MRKNKPLHISVGNLNIDISMYVQSFPGPDESIIADDALISCGGSATN